MSQVSPEPHAIADAVFEAINSGDLDAFMALAAEDVEFTSMVAEAEGTTFRGRDGLRAWWQTIRGAFQNVRWELLDFRATGDWGVTHIRMAGTLSGVPVEQAMWQAVKLRGGGVAGPGDVAGERRGPAPILGRVQSARQGALGSSMRSGGRMVASRALA